MWSGLGYSELTYVYLICTHAPGVDTHRQNLEIQTFKAMLMTVNLLADSTQGNT
jgi:hypothetical protein